ncbi:VOC family protein [Phosphitispora fastidiosa]|uniref:VOC family protein n=1 Tax=Phosphitispora fastidiosa TaxID=2837202 RepID=UPI001E5C021C|nr:VOC family protein [Phosphitispora fastidiosa]MBU7008666.1 catechol 2 [Phosphitispora fastidiosa]
MFKRIDHIAFIVKDRHHSIKFYEDNFGFKSYFEHDVPVQIAGIISACLRIILMQTIPA